MTCDDVRAVLGAFHDDEITDALLCIRVAEHLETCASCAHELEAMSSVSRALRVAPQRFEMPAGMRERIEAATEDGRPKGRETLIAFKFRPMSFWLMFAGLVVLSLAISLSLVQSRRKAVALADELVSNHLRSLQAGHLMDVPSTDQHTVKPWFQGRIDFSPAVPNLVTAGFPLIGGRLDYLENRPVAALVYTRGKHVINVLVAPHLAGVSTGGVRDRNGFHLVEWYEGGLDYWAVSDVNSKDLLAFRAAFQAAP